mmetsp:Transcript_21958/g.32436  ORF Transcript_21958/g.32436 Transcript_21958/m.32436 type:complete len:550 (+) Transcript_21958:73-1722(+)
MAGDEKISDTDDSDGTRTPPSIKKSKRDNTRARKRKKKERKRERNSEGRKKSSRRKRDYYSASSSDYSESSYRRYKKRKKKKERRRKKEDKSKASPSGPLQRNHTFAESLLGLLEDHPALSTDLPIMLIQMAGGRGFNLSQMTDASVAQGLERVFESLAPFGVQFSDSAWHWKPPGNTTNPGYELLLIKVAKTLLDEIGITMEAVEQYGLPEEEHQHEAKNFDDGKKESNITPLQRQMQSLFDRFIQVDSTLPQQMAGLCEIILSGESIALDGLPDDNLRQGLKNIFRGAGLEYSLMEDDEDEEESNNMGYGLPVANDDFARINIQSIFEACNDRAASVAKEAPLRRVVKGPLPEHMADSYPTNEKEDDFDDDDGPLPAGLNTSRRALSAEVVNELSKQREDQLDMLDPEKANATKPGEREEWMVNPGEHDLLQNIKSGTMKNRSFENKKARAGTSVQQLEAPVHPSVQAEIDAIMEANKNARGASLMDQHRENKAIEKAMKAGDTNGRSFDWSREKDLDADRRVDKDALRLLMGGASGQLKDKFQGGV